MKTCGLTLKIAEIRYRNVVLFLVPSLFIWAFCCCFFVQNALVCFMDILFTVSNTVKLFLFYHTVNSISTVPPVVNNKGTKTDLLFTGMLLNVNITCGHTVPNFSVKTVDCMFCMQIPVKLKHKSLCSFCSVSNSQYFETWCTLIDCMYLVKWKQELFFDRIISSWVRFPVFW